LAAIKQMYRVFCKVEETAVAVCIVAITALVFLSAVLRTINHPINWAQDFSLLLFAWVVFLGADVALRRADFLRVDIIVSRFPEKLREALYYIWYMVAIVFLAMLVCYGIPLALENTKRPLGTMAISYSWVTISVPIGSFLMIITIIIKLVLHRKGIKPEAESKEAF